MAILHSLIAVRSELLTFLVRVHEGRIIRVEVIKIFLFNDNGHGAA
jgi:hypothetical protein